MHTGTLKYLSLPFPKLQSIEKAHVDAPTFSIISVTSSIAEIYCTLGPHQQAGTKAILMDLQRFWAPMSLNIKRINGRPPHAQNWYH